MGDPEVLQAAAPLGYPVSDPEVGKIGKCRRSNWAPQPPLKGLHGEVQTLFWMLGSALGGR